MSAVFLTYFLKFFYHYKEDMCFNLLLSFNFNMPQILTKKVKQIRDALLRYTTLVL